jgi:hypothetical protein
MPLWLGRTIFKTLGIAFMYTDYRTYGIARNAANGGGWRGNRVSKKTILAATGACSKA